MSETITASLTVSGGDTITAEINTLARGPAGPTGASGASTWDDITGTASDVPFLPVAAPAHSEGLVFYDSTDKSLTYYNDEADVSMNIGREMWVRVRNDSGSQISNGKVVYINDALGQLPTIRLARADSATTSRVIGIATHDIGNNEFGYVTSTGEIKGLNTIAYSDGDALYLSAVTAGEMTTTAPTAPNRTIQVATVLHAHVSQGKLYCHPENDSVASTGIVDSTATGRALITAATQSDARTTGLGSGATGDALFTAATPAAARETALNEILKYDANAAASRTNPSAQANDDTLVGINLTAGMWEFDFSFSFDAGACGVAPRFLFGTIASVDLIDSRVIGGVFRADQALASLIFRTTTGTITPAGNGASTNVRYSGFWTMNITGNTTLDMQFARNADSAGTTIIRRAGAFLRARKING